LAWATASRDDSSVGEVDGSGGAKLDLGLSVVLVVVVVLVVGAEIAGVTASVVVVVGDGMTTPEGGRDTTPIDDVSVGPFGWLRGTNMIPRIPTIIKARETAHHIFCEGRFPSGDFTSPNLV
jgi:hypothetical protein